MHGMTSVCSFHGSFQLGCPCETKWKKWKNSLGGARWEEMTQGMPNGKFDWCDDETFILFSFVEPFIHKCSSRVDVVQNLGWMRWYSLWFALEQGVERLLIDQESYLLMVKTPIEVERMRVRCCQGKSRCFQGTWFVLWFMVICPAKLFSWMDGNPTCSD